MHSCEGSAVQQSGPHSRCCASFSYTATRAHQLCLIFARERVRYKRLLLRQTQPGRCRRYTEAVKGTSEQNLSASGEFRHRTGHGLG